MKGKSSYWVRLALCLADAVKKATKTSYLRAKAIKAKAEQPQKDNKRSW